MATIIVPLISAAIIVGLITALLVRRPGARMPNAEEDAPGQSGEERVRAYGLVLRDRLDRTPFGPELPRMVWRKLMTCPPGEGLVREFHRDFCGQGLIRTQDGVKLCDIFDGGLHTGDAITSWPSEEAFVGFFAAQSDYSCSGWDETSAVFATQDEWYRNNQRLTREGLQVFIAELKPR
ncbi:hypothetical protein [Bosea psychrotolerans]|nr:hypothetical protein [Bosea psychrotolerans]